MYFLEFSCVFYNPLDVGNLISGSSALEYLEVHSSHTIETQLGEF